MKNMLLKLFIFEKMFKSLGNLEHMVNIQIEFHLKSQTCVRI